MNKKCGIYIGIDAHLKCTNCTIRRDIPYNFIIVALSKSDVKFIKCNFSTNRENMESYRNLIITCKRSSVKFKQCNFRDDDRLAHLSYLFCTFGGHVLIKDCNFENLSHIKNTKIVFIFKGVSLIFKFKFIVLDFRRIIIIVF